MKERKKTGNVLAGESEIFIHIRGRRQVMDEQEKVGMEKIEIRKERGMI